MCFAILEGVCFVMFLPEKTPFTVKTFFLAKNVILDRFLEIQMLPYLIQWTILL
jgi:hypothetical protein